MMYQSSALEASWQGDVAYSQRPLQAYGKHHANQCVVGVMKRLNF